MNDPEAPRPPPDPPPTTPEPSAETPPFIATLQGVWERIKHHKVVQWTLAYLAVAYTLLHGAEMLTGSLGWPHGWVRLFTLLLILGVPIVITLAWYHGSRGQQRASGTEIMIIALLIALGGAFLWRDSSNHERVLETEAVATPAWVATSPVVPIAPDDKSIAVLPFVDMSAGKDQEHMSDGIAEELLNLLAQVPDLKVIARTSSFAFKDQDIDVAEIGKKLNVAHILEGSVRTSGNKLRITAQLVRTADSTHLWSERYDRPMGDIFAVQDDIANAIVQALRIRLKGGTLSRRAGGTQNLEAYEFYLRSEQATKEGTEASIRIAIDLAQQAIELDPNFGLALYALSDAYSLMADSGYLPSGEGYELSRKFAQQAVQVSPDLSRAQAQLAYIHVIFDWDWAAADSELKRALAVDPNDTTSLLVAAKLACTLGRFDDAVRHLLKAKELDPLNHYTVWNLGNTYYLAGRFQEAERAFRRVLELAPDFGWTRGYLGKTLLAMGKPEEAYAAIEQDEESDRMLYLPIFSLAVGRKAEADAALAKQIEVWGDTGAFFVAQTYAYRGHSDHAIAWLERAYQQKDAGLVEITGEPLFKGMSNDPRYKAFLRKMNLPSG